MCIESVMPSNHFILCRPLLLLPSIFPSIRVFSNESALHVRWPKYWSFSISLSNEYSEPISFTIDWFDLLAVQGTLKNLLQHHSQKHQSCCSAFFMVQLTHPYMTTGKTIAMTRWIFVGKVMSLFFNMLSRFVIAFSLILYITVWFLEDYLVNRSSVETNIRPLHRFFQHCKPLWKSLDWGRTHRSRVSVGFGIRSQLQISADSASSPSLSALIRMRLNYGYCSVDIW